MENSNDNLNKLASKFSINGINQDHKKRLDEYNKQIKDLQEQDRINSGAFKVNAQRTSIAPIKTKIFYTQPQNGKNGTVRYNLQELDADEPQAYLALENWIQKQYYSLPYFSHAIVYLRDPSIPNGVPIGTYSDTQAFPIKFFYYYKNSSLKLKYFQEVQHRINNLIQLGELDHAQFLEAVFKRALYM